MKSSAVNQTGKTIEQKFDSWVAFVYPNEADMADEQRIQLCEAFFAGASATLGSVGDGRPLIEIARNIQRHVEKLSRF